MQSLLSLRARVVADHMMDGEDIGGIVMLVNMDVDGKKVIL